MHSEQSVGSQFICGLTVGLFFAFFIAAPQGYTQGRPVPGQKTSKNGVIAGRIDVGGIRAGLSGGGPAVPLGSGRCAACSGTGCAGASLKESSCSVTQTLTVSSPAGGNGPAQIYSVAPDLGGGPSLPGLGFLGDMLMGARTVHGPSGELRFAVPLFQVAGFGPGFDADFRLFYRSVFATSGAGADSHTVREVDGIMDKRPFGPGFRPFWGDKIYSLNGQQEVIAPSSSQGAVVYRVDCFGTLMSYTMGVGGVSSAGGRGDRLVFTNSTWYRELPDRTLVEYGSVDSSTERYIEKVFWIPSTDISSIPGTWPLIVDYVYDTVATGGPVGLTEIQATRNMVFKFTWGEQDTGKWRVEKIHLERSTMSSAEKTSAATNYAITFDYDTSSEARLTSMGRPPRDFLDDCNQDKSYGTWESFTAIRPTLVFGWDGSGRLSTISKKSGTNTATLITNTYANTWRISTQAENGATGSHSFTYNDVSTPPVVTWTDPVGIPTDIECFKMGSSTSHTKWFPSEVERKTRVSGNPRGSSYGVHSSLTWSLTWSSAARGNLTELIMPSGRKWQWSYDSSGRGLVSDIVVHDDSDTELREWVYTYENWDVDPRKASRLNGITNPKSEACSISFTIPTGSAWTLTNLVMSSLAESSTTYGLVKEDVYRRIVESWGPIFEETGGTDVRTGQVIQYYATSGAEYGLPSDVIRRDDRTTGYLSITTDYDSYTGLGWLSQVTNPGSGSISFTYDNNGAVLETTRSPVSGNIYNPGYNIQSKVTRNYWGDVVRSYKVMKDRNNTAYTIASGTGGYVLVSEHFFSHLRDLRETKTQKGKLSAAYSSTSVLTTTNTYDDNHRLTEVQKSPGGQEVDYSWDDQNMLWKTTTKVDSTRDQVTCKDYDEDGNATKSYSLTHNGPIRSYTYDDLGRLTRETLSGWGSAGVPDAGCSDGRYRQYVFGSTVVNNDYDLLNEVAFKKSDGTYLSKVTYEYDTLRRRMKKNEHKVSGGTETLEHEWTFNESSKLVQKSVDCVTINNTDKEWGTTHAYDGLGREVWVNDTMGTTDSSCNRVERVFDTSNNTPLLTRVTKKDLREPLSGTASQISKVTNYTYDGFGRLVKQSWPFTDSGSSSKTADAFVEFDSINNKTYSTGRAESTVTQGNRVRHEWRFDALGRQVEHKVYPEGGSTTINDELIYDDTNRKVTAKDHYDKETTTERNHAGWIIKKYFHGWNSANPARFRMVWAYDQVGRITSRTDGNSNVVNYAYESDTGLLESRSLGTGAANVSLMVTKEEFEYNDLGRPITECTKWYSIASPANLVKATTSYDGLSRVTAEEYWYSTQDQSGAAASTMSSTYISGTRFQNDLTYHDYSYGTPTPTDYTTKLTYKPDNIGRTTTIDLTFYNQTWSLADYTYEGNMVAQRMLETKYSATDAEKVKTIKSYNQLNQITELSHDNVNTSSNIDYTQGVVWSEAKGRLAYLYYPHADGGSSGGFTTKYDHYYYDSYGRKTKFKFGGNNSTPTSYDLYRKWTLDCVGNWDKTEYTTDGSAWTTDIDPTYNNTVSNRYTKVDGYPVSGTETDYTYDYNGFLINDGKFVYVPDMHGRLAEVYLIVETQTLSSLSSTKSGTSLTQSLLNKTKPTLSKKLSVSQVRALVKTAHARYWWRFNLNGATQKIPKLNTPTPKSSTSSIELYLIAWYGYTVNGRDERVVKTQLNDVSFWAYDQGAQVEEYNSTLGLRRYQFAGVKTNEHIAQFNYTSASAGGDFVFHLQDVANNAIKTLEFDSFTQDLSPVSHIDYDSRGRSFIFDPDGSMFSGTLSPNTTYFGVVGGEWSHEVSGLYAYVESGCYYAPAIGFSFVGEIRDDINTGSDPKGPWEWLDQALRGRTYTYYPEDFVGPLPLYGRTTSCESGPHEVLGSFSDSVRAPTKLGGIVKLDVKYYADVERAVASCGCKWPCVPKLVKGSLIPGGILGGVALGFAKAVSWVTLDKGWPVLEWEVTVSFGYRFQYKCVIAEYLRGS